MRGEIVASEPMTSIRFKLRVGGGEIDVESHVPAGAVPLGAVLPAIQPIASAIVEAAVAPVVAAGAAVSCRAGCGACCRQPVPIAECEAEHLVRLLARMPETRRQRVEARFEAAEAELEAAGLLADLEAFDTLEDSDARQRLGSAYFDLGIACPFLEDESCGIHPDRPLACREYLVTSPASACAAPTAESVDMIPIPMRPSVALFRMDDAGAAREPRALVLALARRFIAGRAPAPVAASTGPALLERWVRGLAGGGA